MSRNYVMQTDSHTLTIIAGIFTAFVLTVGIASFGGEVANYLVTSAEQVHEKQSESQLNIKSITQTASAQNNCPGYGKNFGGGNTCYRSGSTTYTVVLASSTTPGGANAQCNVSPTSTTVGSSVTFDGSGSTASSSITSYGWSFGDGDTATTTTATTSHTYNATGTYSGSLTITTAGGNSDTASCPSVTVSSTNACPTAKDDTYTINPGQTINGDVSDDTDPNGDSLTYSQLTNPSYGTVTSFNNDGTFTYKHDGGSTSTDSFKYEVSDGSCTRQATVEIKVNNQKPIAVIDGPSSIDYCQSDTFDGSNSYDQDDGGTSIEYYNWSANPSSTRIVAPREGTAVDTVDTAQITWTDPTDLGLVVTDDEGATSDLTEKQFTVDAPGYDANIIDPSDTPKRLWITASSTNRSTKATVEVTDLNSNTDFAENYSWSDIELTYPKTSGIPTSIIQSTSSSPTASTPGKFTFWIKPQNNSQVLSVGTYDITAAIELKNLGPNGSCVYDKERVQIDLRAQTTAEF